jgi:hypothetical protein
MDDVVRPGQAGKRLRPQQTMGIRDQPDAQGQAQSRLLVAILADR